MQLEEGRSHFGVAGVRRVEDRIVQPRQPTQQTPRPAAPQVPGYPGPAHASVWGPHSRLWLQQGLDPEVAKAREGTGCTEL